MDIYDFVQQLKPNNILVLNKNSNTDELMFINLLNEVYAKNPSEIWCLSQLCYDSIQYKSKILLTHKEYIEKLKEKYNKRPKMIIGVTGSYGKSSTCCFLYEILKQLNYSVCISGSNGNKSTINNENTINNNEISGLTTMGTAGLYKFLYDNAECDFAILEISSIAVKQNRMCDIVFNGGIFTSFIEEHLDMHDSLEEYFQYKMKFIDNIQGPKILFNNINVNGMEYIKYPNEKYYIGTSGFVINNEKIDVQFNIQNFQMQNILGALTLLYKMNVDLSMLKKNFMLNNIPGCMEYIGKTITGGNVYIDGAHAAEQVDNILCAIDADYHNTIIVYGASGKRLKTDLRSKEFLKKFDNVIITDDTPYPVNPLNIREQLMEKHFINIGNRIEAIKKGISMTTKDKTLIILGKSTETNNIIDYNYYTIFYNEKIVVQQLLLMEKII